ncbi:MAG: Ig-like domain-containing protein [Lachnospiraceae bacterium]|nr:Ig-like domain-containing protein [Lachnospiraceae bacterium]
MKKKKLKLITGLSVLTLVIILTALSGVTVAQAASKKSKEPEPTLRKESVTLYVGWEPYEIFIDDLDEEATVTYKSTAPEVASVDEEGVVYPGKKGTATIKVTVKVPGVGKYKLKLAVKVKKPDYTVTDYTDAITTNGSYIFTLKRHGYDGEVSWFLRGSQFANIEAVGATDCIIRGKAVGDVTLSVTSNNKTTFFDIHVYEGTGTAFRITEQKDPYNGNYMTRGDYNKYTRDYYVVRSYLERLASLGGGMLIFSKGTYTITNTLCIPSNTTILIEDGARIVKTDYTGSNWLNATQSLFQTVSYFHTTNKFTEYNGEHDITIKGEGSACIDLNFVKCTALVACHCERLYVEGVAFKNLNSLHFIELDASRDVHITNNLFSGCVESPTQRKEAINLDTPDVNTGGFSQDWTSYDCTPDLDVWITGNVFENLETAIGTHKYTEGKYHTNIFIEFNTFVDVTSYVIRMMNWKDSVISGNYFLLNDLPEDTKTVNAVVLNGAINPTVTANYFRNFTTAITAAHWKNKGLGKEYEETDNDIKASNIRAMRKNEVVDCVNDYFEVYRMFGDTSEESLMTYKFYN